MVSPWTLECPSFSHSLACWWGSLLPSFSCHSTHHQTRLPPLPLSFEAPSLRYQLLSRQPLTCLSQGGPSLLPGVGFRALRSLLPTVLVLAAQQKNSDTGKSFLPNLWLNWRSSGPDLGSMFHLSLPRDRHSWERWNL